MAAEWFFKQAEQAQGPLSFEQLKQLAAAGQIIPQTEVRRAQDDRWYKAKQIPGLCGAGTPPKSNSTATTVAVKPAALKTPKARPPVAVVAAASIPSGIALPPVALPPVAIPVGALSPVAVRPAVPMAAIPLAAIPQGVVPGGIPVGVPAGVSAIPPVGIPVGAPVGFALAPSPSPGPTFVSQPARAAKEAGDELPTRKNNNSLLIVAGLSGTCVAVAVIGGLLVYLNQPGPAKTDAKAAPNIPVTAAAEANPPLDAEANPSLAVAPATTPVAAAVAQAGKSSATSSGSGPAAGGQLARLKGIAKWSELHLPHQFTSKSTRVTILSAWLAADETGRRITVKREAAPLTPQAVPATAAIVATAPAAEPTAATTPAQAAPPAAAKPKFTAAEPAKYLFVEVKIMNTSAKPLHYQGWNSASEKGALLAGVSDVFSPVPLNLTPSAARLAATEVPPGQAVTDVLVFAAPAQLTEKLRLALPQTTLLANAKGHCAVEIAPEMLLSEPSLAAAALAGDTVMGSLRTPENDLRLQIAGDTALTEKATAEAARLAAAAPAPAAAAPPPDAAQPVAAKLDEMKKEDLPPTREELNKLLEEGDKAPAPAKPIDPAEKAKAP